ncbi:MAG: peptide-methionine (S)-S-oxide reductase MsrA [Flavobacteriaceae bacterium]|nr:peptide-methionine (S)-S-oxide reductase MsrA [Flavobacteriaceae bacterium]
MTKIFLTLLIVLSASACNTSGSNSGEKIIAKRSERQLELDQNKKLKKAYFAAGCFWCVEAIYESIKGVKEAVSGYAGGTTKNPNYKLVAYGKTDHAESVEVFYDPELVSFETLVRVFYGSHDPTTRNQQGPDKGSQYRSIAFYSNDQEKEIVERVTKELNKSEFKNKITTEIKKINIFYKAEDYHQDYEKNNPNQPYVVAVSIPRLNKFKARFPELLKDGE